MVDSARDPGFFSIYIQQSMPVQRNNGKENQGFSGANALLYIFTHFLALWSKLCKHDVNYVKRHLGNLKHCMEAGKTSVAPAPIGLCTLTSNYIVEHFAGGITFCLEL
jgi:hypothetical protein